MGILFRGRRALEEQNNKVLKRQYGGAIPFYASYTYKETPTAPYNPSALLSKYKGAAPAKSAKAESGGDKKSDLNIDALPNDAAVFGDQWLGIQKQIQLGESQNPNFKNTSAGQNLYQQADMYSTVRLNDMKKRREAFDQAKETIYGKNNSANTWVVQNGMGMVRGKDPETEKVVFDFIPLNEINKENEFGWNPVSYKDALELSATSTEDNIVNNLALTLNLNHGLGMDKVRDQIDGVFKDIGSEGYKNESKIGGKMVNNQVIKEIARGDANESNMKQLQAAFNTLEYELKTTSAWDTLLGNAWRTSKTEEEASQKIHQYLALQMMKRLNIATEETRSDMMDFEETKKMMYGGSGSDGPVKVLSRFLDAFAGQTEVRKKTFEVPSASYVGGELKLGKSKSTSFDAYNANYAHDLLSPFEIGLDSDGDEVEKAVSLVEQKDFGKIADLELAQLPDGTKLKDMYFKFGSYTMKGTQAMTMAKGSETSIAVVPVDKNGKMVHLDGVNKFNAEMKKLEEKKANDSKASNGSTYVNEKYDQDVKALESKYIDQYKGKFVFKKFYIMDVIYNKYEDVLPEQMKDFSHKDVTGDDVIRYNNKFTAEVDSISWGADPDTEEYYGKTTIFIPARDELAHQRADAEATVYTEQANVMAGSLAQDKGSKEIAVTKDDLLKAITNRFSSVNYFYK
jgi:hypothetical protein